MLEDIQRFHDAVALGEEPVIAGADYIILPLPVFSRMTRSVPSHTLPKPWLKGDEAKRAAEVSDAVSRIQERFGPKPERS